MAKYSTGGGGRGEDGAACELCGAETDTLQSVAIAGASLEVCRSCAPHDDRGPASERDRSEGGESDRPDPGRRAAQRAAKMADASKADPNYWLTHGTNYEDDPLPYLVSGYGDAVKAARQDAGLTLEELAERIDLPVGDIEAIEQSRAARAGIGGSAVRTLEEALDVELIESE